MTPADKQKLIADDKIREANSRGIPAKPEYEVLAQGQHTDKSYRHWSWILRRFWRK